LNTNLDWELTTMLDLSRNINSLSNFKRRTAEFLEQMKATGAPMALTINGKAELVVQDAGSYQRLLDLADRLDSLEVLRKSLEDVEAGRRQPMRRAIERLGKGR
jgi:PHD/YefM family antitoxin component YafN of YafNO toxin-antitoxin module